jgi:hypothetical protein
VVIVVVVFALLVVVQANSHPLVEEAHVAEVPRLTAGSNSHDPKVCQLKETMA